MKSQFKFWVILGALFILFIGSKSASANNVYIGQSATGAANGADCNDTYAYTFFNTSTNWGSGANKIGPGTTVHLCGTITSNLIFQGSGTSGNVITLHFETGAMISEPTFGSASALNLGSQSYILVDGGTPCGWNVATNSREGTCNGMIQTTANGQGLAYNNGDVGIAVTGSNIEIRNVWIHDIYVPSGNTAGPANIPSCFYVAGPSNISIHDSACDNAQDGFYFVNESSTSGYYLYNNYISNISWGFAGTEDGTSSDVNIYGNWVGNFAAWLPTTSYHHDGIYVWCDAFTNACGTMSNWNVYSNVFSGTFGNAVTSYFYIDNTEATSNVNFFNNVIAPTDVQSGGGSGYTAMYPAGTSTYTQYNNTYVVQTGSNAFACYEGGSNGAGLTVAFENNLMQNCAPSAQVYTITFNPIDYNVYATCQSGFGVDCWTDVTTPVSFSTWKADIGGDTHSNYYPSTSAGLNANYVPTSGSVAIQAGANLTGVCSGQPNPGLGALCYDAAGNLRPLTGSWDVGAYQSSTVTQPPTGVAAAAH